MRRVHSVVRAALEQAVRWDWIATNPAARASPGHSEASEVRPPAAEAVLALLDRAERDDHPFAVFLVLAAVTGARRGELVALRWTDLSLDSATLTITRTMSVGAEGPVERARPKTRSSVRRIALDQGTIRVLRAHWTHMSDRALACGTALSADAFVFSNEADCSIPWRPDFVSLKFRRLRHGLGLDDVRLHDYPDLRVIPTSGCGPLRCKVIGLLMSA